MITTEKKIFTNLKINKKNKPRNLSKLYMQMRQITPNIGLINLVGH